MSRGRQRPGFVAEIAAQVLAALDRHRQIPPFSRARPELDFDTAYAVAAELRQRREARGEKHVGRKIGFTNRNIWAQYGVDRPIWGDVFATTLHDLADLPGRFPLANFSEPQIEPEIAFKLAAAPRPGMDEAALLSSIEWVAPGYEIVQSIFPGWRFAAVDTVTATGLHGALLLGRPLEVAPARIDKLRGELSTFAVALRRDGAPVDRGHAANVLGGPLSALRHLVETLARDKSNPPLRAGEIVTTGTLTRAFPVAAGETWTATFTGIALAEISLTFG